MKSVNILDHASSAEQVARLITYAFRSEHTITEPSQTLTMGELLELAAEAFDLPSSRLKGRAKDDAKEPQACLIAIASIYAGISCEDAVLHYGRPETAGRTAIGKVNDFILFENSRIYPQLLRFISMCEAASGGRVSKGVQIQIEQVCPNVKAIEGYGLTDYQIAQIPTRNEEWFEALEHGAKFLAYKPGSRNCYYVPALQRMERAYLNLMQHSGWRIIRYDRDEYASFAAPEAINYGGSYPQRNGKAFATEAGCFVYTDGSTPAGLLAQVRPFNYN